MKSTIKKKLISTALAAIMSVSTLAGTVSSSYAAKVPDYNWATSCPDGIDKAMAPSDLTQFAYIKYYEKGSSTPTYEVIATKPDAKIRLYYDEAHQKYNLTSTSTATVYFKYKCSRKGVYSDEKHIPGISFKPNPNITIGNKANIYLNGDVNCDRSIDIEDATMVINHIYGKKALDGVEAQFANTANEWDLYGNNSDIDIEDAVLIMNYINGKTSRL